MTKENNFPRCKVCKRFIEYCICDIIDLSYCDHLMGCPATWEPWVTRCNCRDESPGYDPRKHRGTQLPDTYCKNLLTISTVERSCIKMGNLQIHTDKRWWWIHRLMMKIFFGWKVENIKE